MLIEILIACFFVLLLGFVFWGLFGLLLLPVFGKNMVTFCFSQDAGSELEQRVRAYGWLRENKRRGGRFVIVDCGLSEKGLLTAQHLRRKYTWVDYCPNEAMEDYVHVLHHCLENGEEL
ncbi:MAG: hypothetical protein J6J43_06090 [Oscillospiraceae bacterium]|nr:hypothetical protein [Oscillospiraceae bacterium]